jgi:hypothetical protein
MKMDTDLHRYDQFSYLSAYRFLSMLSHSSTGLVVVSLGKISTSRALGKIFPGQQCVAAGMTSAGSGIAAVYSPDRLYLRWNDD